MPTSAPNLLASSFARPWKHQPADSSRSPRGTSIPLKPQTKTFVEELPDDFVDVQKDGEAFLRKSRQASSGFSLPDARCALLKFGLATQMAPQQAAPHAGIFAAWRAVHADALGARPFWSKKRSQATCEKSAAAMLHELSWLVRHGSVEALDSAIDAPEDLFVGLGHREGAAALKEHLLPALMERFGAASFVDERLQARGIGLVHTLLVQQPWVVPHALALVEKMIGRADRKEQAGCAFSALLFSLGQRRHASAEEWLRLGDVLVDQFGKYSAVMLPLMPLLRRGMREARDDLTLHGRYIALLVGAGCLGEDRSQLFECVRLLTEEVHALVAEKDGIRDRKPTQDETGASRALCLIRHIQTVCEHAKEVCGPRDRLVAQLGAERLHELSRQADSPKIAMAAFSARAALGFGVRPL